MANFGRSTYIAWGEMTLDLIDINSTPSAHTDAIDTTRYGTVNHEYEPGYTDYGGISVTIGTDRTTDITALLRAHEDHTKGTLSIVTPVGRQMSYSAFITDLGHVLDKNGLYTLQVTFKFSGAPTYTEYTNYHILPLTGTRMYKGCSYGLFLSGNDTDFGGGAVHWDITTAGIATGTRISGNTLIIAANETKTPIEISAHFRPIMELANPVTASYNIVAPPISTITLTGADTITFESTSQAPKTEMYTTNTYPIGAEKVLSCKITHDGTDVDVDKGIKITNAGVLTITPVTYMQNFTTENTKFVIVVSDPDYTYIKTTKEISVIRHGDIPHDEN